MMADYKPMRDLLIVIGHYFKEIIIWFEETKDFRNQSYVRYPCSQLIFTRLMGSFCQLKSMRHMNETFNNEHTIKTMNLFFGVDYEEVPHGDTINWFFERTDYRQLRDILYKMFKELKDKRILDNYRINNEEYQIIIDGVNLFSHTNNCRIEGSLVVNHQSGDTIYKTDMLVAVVSMGNIILPLDFEPIENTDQEYDKQDCELKASKRLIERIKSKLPKLKICLSGDALYFNESILEMVETNNWKYIIRYKEGSAPSVHEYYEVARKGKDIEIIEIGNEIYEFYNGIPYHDKYIVNRMVMKKKDQRFDYVTNYEITYKNIESMIKNGRKRWKIENKGFNDLKNHGMEIGHAFSLNSNAMKCHVSIIFMAHIINQLLRHYHLCKNIDITIRKMGEDIKIALSSSQLSATDIEAVARRIQVRLEYPY